MKKVLIVVFSLTFLFYGCRKDNLNAGSDNEIAIPDTHDEPSDYVWLASDVIPVIFNGSSISMEGEGATIEGSIITIMKSGTYSFSGKLNDGQVIVDSEDEDIVRLIFNGIDLNCSNNPPLVINASEKTMIVLNDDTKNTISDGGSYAADEYNAAIYSADDLTFFGNGELVVNANYNDGITSKDGLIIASGIITVNAQDDAIIGKDYLIVKDGEISIISNGDGLKSNNDEDVALGYITILDGKYDLKVGSDAIQAEITVTISNGELVLVCGSGKIYSADNRASSKGIKAGGDIMINGGNIFIDATEDGLNSGKKINVDSGFIEITSGDDGIKADTSITILAGNINIIKSVEGIESANVIIAGGNVSVVSSDDGINTTYGVDGEQNDGSLLSISSGYVYVSSSNGDGIDSNGDINITGGTLVVHGSSTQGGFDVNGTALISGGFAIISGTNNHMTEGFSPNSEQNSVLFRTNSNIEANTIICLMDEDDNPLFAFAPSKNYKSIVFSSLSLEQNTAYKLYTGGSYSNGTNDNGVFKDGNYSPGDLKTTFTATSKFTEVNF